MMLLILIITNCFSYKMVGKNDRISDMCFCFARNESNENVRISYSITKSGSVDVYVVFTYLENWNLNNLYWT